MGSAGAFGLFDGESSLNPAALGSITALNAVFTGVQDYWHVENPAGTASLRETRFPQVGVSGPIKAAPVAVGLSYSNYTSRDFTLAAVDTVALRGEPVQAYDTLSSRGGVSDLRVAGAYRLHERWSFGGGVHVLTGSNRLESRRSFSDSHFLATSQKSEISYAGVGASIGLVGQLGSSFGVAMMARSDGHLNLDRDSTRVARVDLPYTLGFGLQVRPVPKLELASQVLFRTWSGANSDLLEQGGTGADNTYEFAAGGEYTGDLKRPYHRVLRFGARYAKLPFLLDPGTQPSEFALSLGTGARFAQQRAGVDLSLEYAWRRAGDARERALLVGIGVSLRP
jgi:long-subunit fatty acid transport protein